MIEWIISRIDRIREEWAGVAVRKVGFGDGLLIMKGGVLCVSACSLPCRRIFVFLCTRSSGSTCFQTIHGSNASFVKRQRNPRVC